MSGGLIEHILKELNLLFRRISSFMSVIYLTCQYDVICKIMLIFLFPKETNVAIYFRLPRVSDCVAAMFFSY